MNAHVEGGDLPGLKKLMQLMAEANRSVLVGVPAGAKPAFHAKVEFDNGKTKKVKVIHEDGGEAITLAMVAAVHEFGSPEHNIPERSFLRGGIRRGMPKFHALNVDSLKRVLKGDMTIAGSLEKLGVVAVGEVKREFTVGEFAPLKPETIKRKGSSKPLIDTGQLRQSITYQLEGTASANARIVE